MIHESAAIKLFIHQDAGLERKEQYRLSSLCWSIYFQICMCGISLYFSIKTNSVINEKNKFILNQRDIFVATLNYPCNSGVYVLSECFTLKEKSKVLAKTSNIKIWTSTVCPLLTIRLDCETINNTTKTSHYGTNPDSLSECNSRGAVPNLANGG